MSETPFTSTTQEEVVKEEGKTEFQIPTEVSEFVGAGKKYASVEEALKSVPHAQKFIDELKNEVSTLKEEVNKRKAIEEVISEFRNGLPTQEETATTAPQLSQEALMNLVSQAIEAKETQKTAKQNTDKVVAKMIEKFGDKAEAEYIRIARENGLNIQMMNALASKSPDAILKLAGFDNATNQSTKMNSSVNTEAFTGTKTTDLSARVRQGATTKDMVSAWHIAGEKVKQK